jgi:GT2 family glycosyltransferase
MSLSIVIRTRDEAPRLRLTLASLLRQERLDEVVVVDDGSVDHTQAAIEDVAAARAASGEALLFLDGDSLAGPGMVRRHDEAHAGGEAIVGRGELLHLRCTRFFADPETGTPRAGEAGRLARMPAGERERMRVTRAQVLNDFDSIDRRAELGVYPGAGPRRLQMVEADALVRHPECPVLWAAACGSNLSVPREAFLAVGGFNEAIDISEHRELALKLCRAGLRMRLVEGARSYHLTHRSGWRDPLVETGWEAAFFAAHPIAEVKLLSVFWASLAPGSPLPEEARIETLPALAAAARGGADYDAARAKLGLPALGPAPATAASAP